VGIGFSIAAGDHGIEGPVPEPGLIVFKLEFELARPKPVSIPMS